MKHLAGIETGLLAAQAQVSYVAATEDPKPIARWPEPMSIACPRCGHGVPPKEASEPEEPSLAEAPADVQRMMMGVAWARAQATGSSRLS
ncbi:MAG: hypothetical protein KIT09_34825 [Bryobacteraceae bacterium]|nr:hypothetical protein [Bryobacteraceae bacterium]